MNHTDAPDSYQSLPVKNRRLSINHLYSYMGTTLLLAIDCLIIRHLWHDITSN